MPVSVPPMKLSGASVSSFAPVISAPICFSGFTILPIGRDRSEASPVIVARNCRPARIPDISRIVVPLFPASNSVEGSRRPSMPFPLTTRVSPNSSASLLIRSISTPRARRIATVEEQSSPGEKLVTVAVPSAMALNIAAR